MELESRRRLYAAHAFRAAAEEQSADDVGEGRGSARRQRDTPADALALGDQRDIHNRRIAGRWFAYF